MKSNFYLFGFLTTFCISTGLLLGVGHLSGERILLLVGSFSMIITAIVWIGGSISSAKSVIDKTIGLTGFLSALLTAIGFIFKIQHWLYGYMILMSGLLIASFMFLPLFFYRSYKQSINR